MAEKCGGKKRQGEGFCGQAAGHGTSHPGVGRCKLHGGSTPTQEVGAQREELERVARRHLDDPNAEPMQDPGDQLLRLATRVGNAMTAVGQRVNLLNEIGVVTMAGGEQVKAEVKVWTDLIKLLHSVLVDIERLGVEKRIAGVAERNSETFGRLLRAILDDLALSAEQSARVPDVVTRHLQAITA